MNKSKLLLHDEELRRLNPKTLVLNERVDERFLGIIKGLNCE